MPLTDEQVISHRDDLEMLRRHHLWPSSVKGLRAVFLRRYSAGNPSAQTGPLILWGRDPDEYVVHCHDWTKNPMERSVLRYESPEAILADGWEVD